MDILGLYAIVGYIRCVVRNGTPEVAGMSRASITDN